MSVRPPVLISVCFISETISINFDTERRLHLKLSVVPYRSDIIPAYTKLSSNAIGFLNNGL